MRFKYSDLLHEFLNAKLANVDWDIKIDNVQQYWNVFESLLIKIVDEIVPLTEFSGNINIYNMTKTTVLWLVWLLIY